MSWHISARKLPVNCYTDQCRSAVVAPTIYAATRPRPLCESSFWTSKEVQETSRNPAARPRRTQRYRLGALFSSPSHVTARDLAGVYDVTGGRLSSVYGAGTRRMRHYTASYGVVGVESTLFSVRRP